MVAAVGAVMWLAACGDPEPSATESAPNSISIHWSDGERADSSTGPISTPTSVNVPPCDPSSLQVRHTGSQGAGGWRLAYFFIEGPPSPCVLTGPVMVEVVIPSGNLVAEEQATDVLVDPATRDTGITLLWYGRADTPQCEQVRNASPPSEILVHLPGGVTRSLAAAGTGLDKAAPCGTINLWGPQSRER